MKSTIAKTTKRRTVVRKHSDIEADKLPSDAWRRVPGYSTIEVADAHIGDDYGVVRNIKSKRLLTQWSDGAYKKVHISTSNSKSLLRRVHLLMVKGPQPTASHTVDHIESSQRFNNLSSNLRWATQTEQLINRRKRASRLTVEIDYNALEFRDIPTHPDFSMTSGYSISKTNGVVRTQFGNYSQGHKKHCGYVYINLRQENGAYKTYRLHRLVALTWCNGYDNRKIVNHKDHVKHNNDADNLEWITQSENGKAALQFGASRTIAVEQLSMMGEKIAQFPSIKDATRTTGIDHGSIAQCLNDRRNTAGGFKWKKILSD